MQGKIQNKTEKTGSKDGKSWSLVIYTIDGKTVSTFNGDFKGFNQGDLVEYESVKDGKYETIKTMKLVGAGDLSQFKHEDEKPFVDTQRLIVRQNALTQANAFTANVLKQIELGIMLKEDMEEMTLVGLTEKAKVFEDWIMRE